MIPRRALAALLPVPPLVTRSAQAADPAARALAGADLVALAAAPGVSPLLRGAARGRQQSVYEGLRLPGPPVTLVEERWLVGWSREAERGLYLAYDTEQERLFLLLLIDGAAVFLAPGRWASWPAALAESFHRFAPGLHPGPGFEP
ncbi:hypothetical protein JMJ55_24890 [Belnapia sp. T6]|uniref:Uncharacterized protein n=1 Tax=Belnapia mucosa TaxID=2804532 RepID=A0ABS1VA86_9PROT|nr:hypothetical protein [Belnapia mucosa]MBL6458579.1 hypothetical protein [Belnapia mucosa]